MSNALKDTKVDYKTQYQQLSSENRDLKKKLKQAETEREILKNCKAKSVRYAFIMKYCKTLPIITLCKSLNVSRFSYYRWIYQPISKRQQNDTQLDNYYIQ